MLKINQKKFNEIKIAVNKYLSTKIYQDFYEDELAHALNFLSYYIYTYIEFEHMSMENFSYEYPFLGVPRSISRKVSLVKNMIGIDIYSYSYRNLDQLICSELRQLSFIDYD